MDDVEVTQLSEDNTCKYLLQYVLSRRGVCSEETLEKALQSLDGQEQRRGGSRLAEVVGRINLKLSKLDYKLVRVRGSLGAWAYAYVDTAPSPDTRQATSLTIPELKYVQWCVKEMLEEPREVREVGESVKGTVERAVDDILTRWNQQQQQQQEEEQQVDVDETKEGLQWRMSYSASSRQLCQFPDINVLDSERLLVKLCQLRWFYRSEQGQFGLDARAVAELQEYLRERYVVLECTVCAELVLQGVRCACAETAWHVACFGHQVAHVGDSCTRCQKSVLEAVYMT